MGYTASNRTPETLSVWWFLEVPLPFFLGSLFLLPGQMCTRTNGPWTTFYQDIQPNAMSKHCFFNPLILYKLLVYCVCPYQVFKGLSYMCTVTTVPRCCPCCMSVSVYPWYLARNVRWMSLWCQAVLTTSHQS